MTKKKTTVHTSKDRAKGGPAGAHQGGASRGGSRVEPSHLKDAVKKEREKK